MTYTIQGLVYSCFQQLLLVKQGKTKVTKAFSLHLISNPPASPRDPAAVSFPWGVYTPLLLLMSQKLINDPSICNIREWCSLKGETEGLEKDKSGHPAIIPTSVPPQQVLDAHSFRFHLLPLHFFTLSRSWPAGPISIKPNSLFDLLLSLNSYSGGG